MIANDQMPIPNIHYGKWCLAHIPITYFSWHWKLRRRWESPMPWEVNLVLLYMCTHLPSMSGECDVTQIGWKRSIVCCSGSFLVGIRVGKVVGQFSRPHVHVTCLIWAISYLQAINTLRLKLKLPQTKQFKWQWHNSVGRQTGKIPYKEYVQLNISIHYNWLVR
jgi:hypothetical protein